MAEFSEQVAENTKQAADKAEQASDQVADKVNQAKETVTAPVSTPPELKNQATPQQLIERLKWGEPALTILDVRDRNAFNEERIMGAMPMPMDSLADSVEGTLESNRDIYIYGEDDNQTAMASEQLRNAGFTKVAEIKGGLPAWKATGGATEGRQG